MAQRFPETVRPVDLDIRGRYLNPNTVIGPLSRMLEEIGEGNRLAFIIHEGQWNEEMFWLETDDEGLFDNSMRRRGGRFYSVPESLTQAQEGD